MQPMYWNNISETVAILNGTIQYFQEPNIYRHYKFGDLKKHAVASIHTRWGASLLLLSALKHKLKVAVKGEDSK